MRSIRSVFTALVALCAAFALASCSTITASAGAPSSSGPKTVKKILVDYPFTSLPIFGILKSQVETVAKEKNVAVEFTNDNNDLTQQVSNLTTYLNSDIDAVISFPMDASSLGGLAKQYMDAGKLWITYGGDMSQQSGSLQFSFRDSGEQLGKNAGEWAKQAIGGMGKAIILKDDATQMGQERTAGLVAGLHESAPGVQIVAQEQAVTPQDALTATNALLSQYPDVNIVLTAVGDAGQGAYQALIGSGRPADSSTTYVGGLDANKFALEQMKAGTFYRGIVTISPDDISNAMVDYPVSVGAGTAKPLFNVPVSLVTPDTKDALDALLRSFQ
ncbi:ribose transport system substrate-binding protein [Propionibacterium cyclohexanicum]|uniref:Ribose transport system substrate-binding protein n=1 Tax=Propionibacterium cyclohexanicum TaxID=64702 RepID=A0A1H9PIJ2_9ACTN|nr:sugar ABC transporter substrate-binding protein [Propionibacterium cyclohexanicum]SER47383.1 ribose transport system substrate-binding protein [Propionibacterium cyclohexanicum]